MEFIADEMPIRTGQSQPTDNRKIQIWRQQHVEHAKNEPIANQ